MSDGYVKIGTQIDETGLDKGLKNVDTKLKGVEKSTKGTTESFVKLGLGMAGAVAVANTAVKVINDLTASYKTQIKAETQLESAAKNNPYLDSSSVDVLKDYASELQNLGTVGDEELLPMMAKLAAAGRTQEEIMSVMSAATDMAASGAFSMDSAVQSLSKSFGGLAGELGESIPEIKALTAEELKNGGAVKLLAGRYKGIAAEVAAATGTAEQLGNAFGDLKEELGAPFEKGLGPIRTFFKAIIDGWTGVLKSRRELEDATKALEADPTNLNASLTQNKILLEGYKKELQAVVKLANGEQQQYGIISGALREQLNALRNSVSASESIITSLEKQIQLNSQKKKQDAESAMSQAEIDKRNKDTVDYIEQNTKAREKALIALKLQAETENRIVTAEEKLSVYAQSYVSLVSESEGKVSATNSAATSLLATTKQLTEEAVKQKALQDVAASDREELKRFLGEISKTDGSESEKMRALAENLTTQYNTVMDNELTTNEDKLALSWEYAEKKGIIDQQITEAEKIEQEERRQASLESNTKMLSLVNEFATQYANIMSSISSMVTQQIADEALIKTAAADEQFEKGAISAEEYEQKITDIKREAAEEKYKMDMWMWGANILTAISNTALGATEALKLGPIAGPILAAMMIAAGGAQLATVIANKPIPPSFATGGIMGGTSYTGDKNLAMLNSREMMLNIGQQRNLFDAINGDRLGGGNNIQIYNSASNDVTARPEITEDGVKIMIRKTVSKDMSDGRFDNSYKSMQNGLRGQRYTN